jgi:hypothetical protein
MRITKEIAQEVNQFDSVESLLRSGGISIDALDRAAFGFASGDILTFKPQQLKIKWKDDIVNVKYEIQYSKLPIKTWAKKIDLSTPIEVSYERGKFWIEDGHHRYMAAKILKITIRAIVEIKDKPIEKLSGGLSYDDFHKYIFNSVKK